MSVISIAPQSPEGAGGFPAAGMGAQPGVFGRAGSCWWRPGQGRQSHPSPSGTIPVPRGAGGSWQLGTGVRGEQSTVPVRAPGWVSGNRRASRNPCDTCSCTCPGRGAAGRDRRKHKEPLKLGGSLQTWSYKPKMLPQSSGEGELLCWATWGQPSRAIPCSVKPRDGFLGRSCTLLAMVSWAVLVPGFPLQQTPSSCFPKTSSECPNGPRQSTNTELPKYFDQLLRSSVTQVKSAHASIFYFRNICYVLITYLKSCLTSILILQSHRRNYGGKVCQGI